MSRRSDELYSAAMIDGELTIHIAPGDAPGDYSTLCGVDANDPSVGHEPADVPRGAKITCKACFGIWKAARLVRVRDFDPKVETN